MRESASSDMAITRLSPQETAARLKSVRIGSGLPANKFAETVGLSQSQYSQFETARRPLTLDAALKVCDEYGVTLDWLFRDLPTGFFRLQQPQRPGRSN